MPEEQPEEQDDKKKKKKKEKKPKVKSGAGGKAAINAIFFLVLFFAFLVFLYMTIANLSFFGVIPKRVAYKLPIINGFVKKIAAKEKRISLAKEIIEEQKMIKKVGQLAIDLEEEENIDGEPKRVPFLYKLRVVKNKIKEKELGEMFIDNVLVTRFYIGIGNNSPYVRGKWIAKKINNLLNAEADFNLLLPVRENGIYKAKLEDIELFRVRKEDAIFNNSSSEDLLYTWINNIRVALGVPMLADEQLIMREINTPKKEKKKLKSDSKTKIKKIEKKKPEEPSKADLIKKLKKVAQVYEKMELEKIPPIFKKMPAKEVEDILQYLTEKKLAKLFVAIDSDKVAQHYTNMTEGSGEQKKKNFKKLMKVWEKLPSEDAIKIFEKLNTDQQDRILDKMAIKKKARLLGEMSATKAKERLNDMKK